MDASWSGSLLGWLRENANWLSSVVLVGVTTWYAILTRSMAKSSAAATESARAAAEHSATAAAATVAGLDIRLVADAYQVHVRRDAQGDLVGYLGLSVRCEGASVFLHSGWVTEILWEGTAGGRTVGIGLDPPGVHVDLVVMGASSPIKLHRGDGVGLTSDYPVKRNDLSAEEIALYQVSSRVHELSATIVYSLDGSNGLSHYNVRYTGNP